MKITEINVHAGRVIPHPTTSYSNLKPGISYKAVLEEGEDATEATKALQAKAESLLEDHCRHMVNCIQELEELSRKQARIASLQSAIERAQRDLDDVRNGMAPLEINGPPPPSGAWRPKTAAENQWDDPEDDIPDDDYDPEDKS